VASAVSLANSSLKLTAVRFANARRLSSKSRYADDLKFLD